MDDMDQKLESILGNPDIMQQIMKLASQVNSGEPNATVQAAAKQEMPEKPIMDANALRNISNLLSQTGIDRNQQALLNAMLPYIGKQKMQKLEKAMQAAKMAQLASFYFNSGGLKQLVGG